MSFKNRIVRKEKYVLNTSKQLTLMQVHVSRWVFFEVHLLIINLIF